MTFEAENLLDLMTQALPAVINRPEYAYYQQIFAEASPEVATNLLIILATIFIDGGVERLKAVQNTSAQMPTDIAAVRTQVYAQLGWEEHKE